MNGIDCSQCGAHVTVRGLSSCPICRAPMKPLPGRSAEMPKGNAPPYTAHVRPKAAPYKTPGTTALSAKDWLAIVCIPAIVILVGLIIYRVIVPSDSQRYDPAVSDALHMCQRAIASVAEYGGADTPPYTQNYGKQDDFYFAWPKGSFEFTNGFGAKIKMSASCNGKVSAGEITSLTVNGKDFR
jgi:hypothetical protein